MHIKHVLQACLEGGVKLEARGEELRVHFATPPDAGLLAIIKQHKRELLRHLGEQERYGTAAQLPLQTVSARARAHATLAQQRLWMIDRLERGSPAYNMVGAFRLRGHLDGRALEAALNDVVARHEALRTRFQEVDGTLYQIVAEAFSVPWRRVDAVSLGECDRDAAVQAALEVENGWRFDLREDRLVRAILLQCAQDEYVFILNVHHIVCDGWSIELLKREIATAYASRLQGGAMSLEPPAVQFGDYACWLAEHDLGSEQDAQLDYWKRTLAGLPQLHGLPLDHPRPAVQTHAGGRLDDVLDASCLRSIKARCQQRDVTLFMYLQTALSAALGLHSNERDIAIGFPAAGRRHRDAHETIGLFVNTLVLRSSLEDNPTFDEMLESGKRNVLDALAHQDVSFERVVEALKPVRSRAHGPLVQILFALQNQVEGELTLTGMDVERIANPGEPVKFDLQVVAEEAAGQLRICWQYNTDLFEEASVRRIADCFIAVIDAANRSGDTRLYALAAGACPIVPNADVSHRSYARLEQRFEDIVRSHPDRPAVVFEGTQLTYRELDERATALAHRLRAAGVGRDSLVGLFVERSVELVVGIIGTLKAGAAYVPLDVSYPMARLEIMLADCAPAVVLTQHKYAGALEHTGRTLHLLDRPSHVEPAATPATSWTGSEARGDCHDPAYVIYTSGTTGAPKGVVVSHAAVDNLLMHFDSIAPLTAPWNGAAWGSINFDLSVYEIFSALCGGGTLHIVPDRLRLDADALFRWLNEHAIVSTFIYAGYLEPFGAHLAATGRCQALQRLLVGVEPISTAHLRVIAEHLPGLSILNGYGPTEATVCCTLYHFDEALETLDRRVPIGTAVNGLELQVMNAGGAPAAMGAIGELWVGGAGLAREYLNKPEITHERFVELQFDGATKRFYRTGDLVRWLPCGNLEFIGRADEQVKIRGFRVEPAEIEVRLCQHPSVSDAVVVAIGHGATKRLVAYIVAKPDELQSRTAPDVVADVQRGLREFLPDYMVPADIVLLDAIPTTVNGKVDRTALPVPATANSATTDRMAPTTPVEDQLVAIWKDVLQLDDVGTNEDFFELGGHSLHVGRLVGRIRKQFQLDESDLSLEVVFEQPTVAALAARLDGVIRRAEVRAKEAYLASLGDSIEEGVL